MRVQAVALAFALTAAAPAAGDPADLSEFGLVCYCTSRVATPHRLVTSSNNGRILLLARNGVTKSQLAAAGEPVTDRQLQDLRDWGLLTENNGRFRTAFPILGSAEMAVLRARLTPIAVRLSTAIAPDLKAVIAELKRRGQSQSGEAVLFAYILDGLTWRSLETAHALPSQDIDAAHPYWDGTFWAVYPKQHNMPGTNSETLGTTELRMMWTPPVLRWFNEVKTAKRRPGVVVVREDAHDQIYVHGRRAAASIASAIVAAKLDDVIGSADPKQRLLIATHELIWMLLGNANRNLGITVPRALKTGATSLEQVAPLVVVTVRDDRP